MSLNHLKGTVTMIRTRRSTVFVLLILLSGCAHAPPSLSPAGVQAFNITRVVKGLDTLRDVAISANAQTPPLLSTDTTRNVVRYHQATLKTMQTIGTGWQAEVRAGLDALAQTLPPRELSVLAPYLVLLKTLLAEVP